MCKTTWDCTSVTNNTVFSINMFNKFKAALQALVDDIYNKVEEQNRRILALEQEIKELKGEK